MAQRAFPCPECGADVYVPDEYFKPAILCGSCGAPVNRRNGKLFEGKADGLAKASTTPPPSEPVATQETGGIPILVIVVIGLVLVGGAVAAYLLIGPDEPEASTVPTENWQEWQSGEGGFTASYPSQPKEQRQGFPTPQGVGEFNRTWVNVEGRIFDVMYIDDTPITPTRGGITAAGTLDGFAQEVNAEISGKTDVKISGVPGVKAEFTLKGGRLTTMMVLRAEFRVFVIYVENHLPGDSEVVTKFFESVKLQSGVTDPPPLSATSNVPIFLPRGEGREWTIRLNGGTPPFSLYRVPSLPEGLSGAFRDDAYVISGDPMVVGNTDERFEFVDHYGQPKVVQETFRVVPKEGPLYFGKKNVRKGKVGVPYRAWVEIVNHLPELLEYKIDLDALRVPPGLIARMASASEKSELGLNAGGDYLLIRGTPTSTMPVDTTVVLEPTWNVDTESGLGILETTMEFEFAGRNE